MCTTELAICGEDQAAHPAELLSNAPRSRGDKVYSHAQSLAQCVQWLARNLPTASRVSVASHAEAARLAGGGAGTAAIAARTPRRSTARVALPASRTGPTTRRASGARRQQVPACGATRPSLVMSAPNRPAPCTNLLEPLARSGACR